MVLKAGKVTQVSTHTQKCKIWVATQVFLSTVTFSTTGDNSKLMVSARRAGTFSEHKTNPG